MIVSARITPPACIMIDTDNRPRVGLDVLAALGAVGIEVPVVILSARGDLQIAADAIRNGAIDFIEKPIGVNEVAMRVAQAVMDWTRRRSRPEAIAVLPTFRGRELLTPRERLVLSHLMQGASNKQIAHLLKVSPRTVEVHRANIMRKLGVRNAASLMRLVLGGS
jgi:FixJ family two-component response regulator